MTRAAAAMMFAVAVTGRSTSPKLGKPAIFRVEEIRQEIERLSGNYSHKGLMRFMGMAGSLTLHSDGTFEYSHPTCTNSLDATVGTWHPFENRIDFEPEFLNHGRLETTARPFIRWYGSQRINKGDLRHVPWGNYGMQIIATANSVALYPLDPTLRRQIAKGPTVWPLSKDVVQSKKATAAKRMR